MKNLFKTAVVALVIAVSFSACDPAPKHQDDSGEINSAKVDSAKIDSASKVDSTAKTGAAAVDSLKKDSTKN